MEGIERAAREGRVTGFALPAPVQPIAERISEEEFMAAVTTLAKRQGWLVYHTHNSRKSEAGFPDLVLLRRDMLIVAELKTMTGTVSAPQATFLEAFAAAGVKAVVWRPSDWKEIVALLW